MALYIVVLNYEIWVVTDHQYWLVLSDICSNLTRTNTPIGMMFLVALLKFRCIKSNGPVFVCE